MAWYQIRVIEIEIEYVPRLLSDREATSMKYEHRNPEADAKFIEAGGLQSWGCFAVLLAAIAITLLTVIAHVLLNNLIGDPAAWWASAILVSAIAIGAIFFWISRRRKQKIAQEQAWQQEMRR
jgi:hypothetical protein